MDEIIQISEKEKERRRKISEARKKAIAEKRKLGFQAYLKRLRKEAAKRKKEAEKKKEKERKKKEKERERKLKEKKKRPVGRPKKRGPKKKRKRIKKTIPQKAGRKKLPPFIFKIISCKNGNQNKLIGKYRYEEEAYNEFNELKKKDANIIFPVSSTGVNELKNSIDEYVLIEKNGKETSILRNEYGKFVEHTTNQSEWSIVDKFRYSKEETFWVYGYDKRSERKTFLWIFQNIVVDGISTKFDHKQILTYKNKVIIKTSEGYMDIVFCKTDADAIRFYNLLENYVKKYRYKQIFFIGDFSSISKQRKKLENEIIELTGWTRKRVQMKNMTYYNK
jgi:hypothetical protein